ncbi:hypothetical protein JHD48_04700 [Sulfurimonas sp. SAG-AH-194-I05]|nr:hypothetical protein [Sulfurimonas sp. SAG-AH-194-I05]MDF1875028.1 hypothetical protein [Sulfurimonas sp. SAG-AH-194-I05]
MNTSYAMDAYKSRDLNISMRTSSGDVIKLDFANEKSMSYSQQKNENGSQTSMRFSSMQSFSFSMETNGIDKQDKKEIEAFMKIAQPFIDDFMKELKEDAPKSPVNKLAKEIASLFQPEKPRDENNKNNVKNNIVAMFDKSLDGVKEKKKEDEEIQLKQENHIKKIFKEMEKLLEKTLKEFDKVNQNLYA